MEITTKKGYDFYEISSAFQKSIRRGLEKQSLFFAFEIYSSGYSKYIWKRMLIIASEDIGLADNSVAVQVNALFNSWQFINQTGANGSSVPFVHAVMILARAKKSRIVDHAKIYAMKTDDNIPIPDYAFDMHTRKGKIKKRKSEYFINEASKINNVKEIEDDYVEFFETYLRDLEAKKCTDTGYDKRNVVHKSPKDMSKWQRDNNQQTMF